MAFVDIYGEVDSASAVKGFIDHSNDDYVSTLLALLPPGHIWEYTSGDEFYELLRAMSYPLLRAEQDGQKIIEEMDPRTATLLLPDWERVLNLPGDNPSPPTTVADRQQAAHAKLLEGDSPTKDFFEDTASGLGYTESAVSDHIYSPFVAGSAVGDPLTNNGGGGWSFIWEFLCFPGSDDALLKWTLEKSVPAHSQVFYNFLDFQSRDAQFGAVNIYKVCRGPDLWVAVGAAGALSTSPDGITWTARTSMFAASFIYDVIYADGIYIACGVAGKISTSPDGLTWTDRLSQFGGDFVWGLFYSAELDLFVAHGQSGKISTSPDGFNWTARTSNMGSDRVYDVCEGAGVLLAVGDSGKISTSPDGITWTARTSGTAFQLNTVKFTAQALEWSSSTRRFVAVSIEPGIHTSDDGITWRERELPNAVTATDNIAIGNGVILVSANDGTDGRILLSDDGGESWAFTDISFDGLALTPQIFFGFDMFVATGVNGSDIAVSRDGHRWAKKELGSGAEIFANAQIASPHIQFRNGDMRGAGHILVYGSSGAMYVANVSSFEAGPGYHWTQLASPGTPVLRDINVDTLNGTWVVVGDAAGGDGLILTSPDGETWTERSNALSLDLFGVASDNNATWIAVGWHGGGDAYILVSTDHGETWTEKTNSKAVGLDAVGYYGGRWVTTGRNDGVDAYILTSDDSGETWTERTSATIQNLQAVAHNGSNLWVAVGDNGAIVTSPDGATWTARTSGVSEHLAGVHYNSEMGFWRAVGDTDGTTSTILRSYDAITWVEETALKDVRLQNIVQVDNGTTIVVGKQDGYQTHVMISEGAEDDWKIVFTPPQNHANTLLTAAAYQDDMVVAVGWNNDGALILTSEKQVDSNA